MKEYYLERLRWIFSYRKRNFWYCIAKTLCLIVGVPLYTVAFAVEMVLTAVNMILGWIPILGVLITVICKAIIWPISKTFYLCVLTDLKPCIVAMQEIQRRFEDSDSDEGVEMEENAVVDATDNLPDSPTEE